MNDRLTVSVAMAAYNGEKYISKQIESILPQLKETDELVVSINPSVDSTEQIVREYQKKDNRIKIFTCTQKGVLANFENAIRCCKNAIVFLSDQDDVWQDNKIEKQLEFFKDSSVGGVCHECKYIDGFGNLMDVQPRIRENREINFWEIVKKNPVQGSTLAFRRELAKFFLPFPTKIPMHDSWIGIIIARFSKIIKISDCLVLYRQHEDQATSRKHKSFFLMLTDRMNLIRLYKDRIKNIVVMEKF